MNKITFTKEVTYQVDYNGETGYFYHYVDNILNLRHNANSEYTGQNGELPPAPLNIEGTGVRDELIKVPIIGEIDWRTNPDTGEVEMASLLCILPDINKHVMVHYKSFDPTYDFNGI